MTITSGRVVSLGRLMCVGGGRRTAAIGVDRWRGSVSHHRPPCIFHRSLITAHRPPSTTVRSSSPTTVHHRPFTVTDHRPPPSVHRHRPPSTAVRGPLTDHRPVFTDQASVMPGAAERLAADRCGDSHDRPPSRRRHAAVTPTGDKLSDDSCLDTTRH